MAKIVLNITSTNLEKINEALGSARGANGEELSGIALTEAHLKRWLTKKVQRHFADKAARNAARLVEKIPDLILTGDTPRF